MEGEGYSCLKKCNCPADGSACTLGAACDTEHFVCKAGYQRFSDGQAKCFRPGCAAGSLHEAVGRSVSNGQAYAVCTCRGGHPLHMRGRFAIRHMWCCTGLQGLSASACGPCRGGDGGRGTLYSEVGGGCRGDGGLQQGLHGAGDPWLTRLCPYLWHCSNRASHAPLARQTGLRKR